MRLFGWLSLVMAVSLLAGCFSGPGSGSAADSPDSDSARFVSQKYGLVFAYPTDLVIHHDFQPGYFLDERWNTYVPEDVAGDALLALRLPDSNEVTKAVLRLGASDAPEAVQHCLLPPATVARVSRHEATSTRIGGVRLQRVTHSGAGMSHYLHRRSFRTVHNGRCIAIDLIVAGTNPKVYAPPRTPPFSVDVAFRRLAALLQGLQFQD